MRRHASAQRELAAKAYTANSAKAGRITGLPDYRVIGRSRSLGNTHAPQRLAEALGRLLFAGRGGVLLLL
jgi:hypothetical protein